MQIQTPQSTIWLQIGLEITSFSKSILSVLFWFLEEIPIMYQHCLLIDFNGMSTYLGILYQDNRELYSLYFFFFFFLRF